MLSKLQSGRGTIGNVVSPSLNSDVALSSSSILFFLWSRRVGPMLDGIIKSLNKSSLSTGLYNALSCPCGTFNSFHESSQSPGSQTEVRVFLGQFRFFC